MLQYLELLKDIKDNGRIKTDRTGTGTISVFGRYFRHNLQQGFPLLTTKKLHMKSIIGELLWFIGCHMKDDRYKNLPKTNTRYLNDNGISIWNEWQDQDGNLGNVYGKNYTNWQTTDGREINQISEIINQLKTNPDSRRMMVSAWNVGELDKMALPPCHYGYQVYSHEMTPSERFNAYSNQCNVNGLIIGDVPVDFPYRKLSLKWSQRSVDTFLGLPFNIASYALLTHILAQETNHVVGELIGDLGDVHIYSNHINYVVEQLQRQPHQLPEIKINKKSIYDYEITDFEILNYISYPNWKNVPIAV